MDKQRPMRLEGLLWKGLFLGCCAALCKAGPSACGDPPRSGHAAVTSLILLVPFNQPLFLDERGEPFTGWS